MHDNTEIREPESNLPLPPSDDDLREILANGCMAACPFDEGGAPCLRTCTLSRDHWGDHRCSQGHTWT